MRHGSMHPRARLTEDDVLTILWLVDLGYSIEAVARHFDFDSSVIARIADGTEWKHVKRPAELSGTRARNKRERADRLRVWREQSDALILAVYALTGTSRATAQVFGVYNTLALRRLRALGIDTSRRISPREKGSREAVQALWGRASYLAEEIAGCADLFSDRFLLEDVDNFIGEWRETSFIAPVLEALVRRGWNPMLVRTAAKRSGEVAA